MEKIFGLIGEKLGHTYSPIIHRMIMKEMGIEGHYGTFQVKKENLKDVVPGLKALGYSGVNVTIPYKTDIIKYLDSLGPEAEGIGAVNVIAIGSDGMATGYNTDYYGFGMMLEKARIGIRGENVAILGTGGAARAVAQYLKDNGAGRLVFVTRDMTAAKVKFPEDQVIAYDGLATIKNCKTVINCTPVGMYPNVNSTPIKKDDLTRFDQVVDLIYNPLESLLIRQAKEVGARVTGGLYMLVAQAVKSQEIWNEANMSGAAIEKIHEDLRWELL